MPVYDEKYINAKVREFNGIVKTNFLDGEVPEEGLHHTCISLHDYWFCCKNRKKNYYLQVYLEECKYKIKKLKMPESIAVELESDSNSDSQ